ncbi:MAG: hypothetical protein B7O98_06575 [Zestosphaera tikiterensis]|uniref:Radical SAM protein n=1 Tax=Zestosphaera tikiterensis TaxID=1973259 RepID=A0A2R7Y477_9CREN|nr:MAG: hypothetical protein B7O98_06575 [Zestosphaera tikiterensis]
MKNSKLYETVNEGVIKCLVCERRCLLTPGRKGVCRNYLNVEGRLEHLGYGRLSAVKSRPIEVKPLFHYWPGSTALTYSTWGCNFYCPWCQNFYLSFNHPRDNDPVINPERLVEEALKTVMKVFQQVLTNLP